MSPAYHSTRHTPLTARGVAHLVVHGTTGSTSYETIPHVRLETSGDVLSTVDMVVQRRNGPRWLCELDDDQDDELITLLLLLPLDPFNGLCSTITTTASQRYNLRHRAHSLHLPEHSTQLSDSNFPTRMFI